MNIRSLALILTLLVGATSSSCGTAHRDESGATSRNRSAIESILAEDAALAAARNLAPQRMPLHVAIDQYADALAELDFSGTPAPFRRAFRNHIEAWRKAGDATRLWPELRGEMHALFSVLKDPQFNPDAHRFRELEDRIFSTWAEIESAMPPELLN